MRCRGVTSNFVVAENVTSTAEAAFVDASRSAAKSKTGRKWLLSVAGLAIGKETQFMGKGEADLSRPTWNRKSGFLVAGFLPNLKADRLTNRTRDLFPKIDLSKRKSLTLDNGVEFADHLRMERLTKLKISFARPYCSTDRATNENTNGLLRAYFPKGMDFRNITHQQLAKVVKDDQQQTEKTAKLQNTKRSL